MTSRLAAAAARILPVNPIEGREISWPLPERLAHHNCPGIAICVIRNGEVDEAAGFGDAEKGVRKVEADTMFSGASISKPVAAVLALQMVDEGRLSLDAPVNDVLRGWKIPDNDFTREAPVTLRHILCHKAGLTVHGFGDYPGETGPTALDTLLGRPPSLTPPVVVDKTPGGTVRYSGGGTTLVEFLLEELSGKSFEALAAERVFEPLGLKRITFGQPLAEQFRPITALGYGSDGTPLPRGYAYTPQKAAGGIYTSAPDYAAFMVECRKAWLGQSNRLLSRKMAQEMMTRQSPGQFGLGWEMFGEGRRLRFAHGGSNAGYQCNATCFLESGDGAVILTNGMMGIILHTEALNAVAAAFDWKDYNKPPRKVRDLPVSEHVNFVGRYRIVSGVDAPHMDVWSEDGKLFSKIEGMILPPREVFLDESGRLFGQQTPSETEVVYGPDGRVQQLIVYAEGEVEMIRAERPAD